MNRQQLLEYLNRIIDSMEDSDSSLLRARLRGIVSVFPFNEYEYIIAFLLDRGVLSFPEYETLREDYVSANRYLELYELSPRTFGQGWGEGHLQDIDDRFQRPTIEMDPEYDGQYDLWFDGIRTEVKSSRAVHRNRPRVPLASKALTWGSDAPFLMNYQQLKLDTCDVFIFIGVWVDRIAYWVMSDADLSDSRLSTQHRGGIEKQIHITHSNIDDFENYRVEATDVARAVTAKGQRQ